MSRQILTVFNQSVSYLLFNRFFRGFGGQRNQSFQQKRSLSARIVGPRSAIGGDNSVYVIPGFLINQGRVLAGVPGGFIRQPLLV